MSQINLVDLHLKNKDGRLDNLFSPWHYFVFMGGETRELLEKQIAWSLELLEVIFKFDTTPTLLIRSTNSLHSLTAARGPNELLSSCGRLAILPLVRT